LLECWIGLTRESGSDDFFDTSFARSISEQSWVHAVAGNDSQLFRELSANCHSERSEAESKNPVEVTFEVSPRDVSTVLDMMVDFSLVPPANIPVRRA
jgi:hypothetical protein